MDFYETFDNIKTKASETAQVAAAKASEVAQAAAAKAKTLAQIAKANVEIRSEQDKQKKSYLELGKLFYRDYITGEASDEAEYLPWCDKITDSVKRVNELRDLIDDLKAGADAEDGEVEDELVSDEEVVSEEPAQESAEEIKETEEAKAEE